MSPNISFPSLPLFALVLPPLNFLSVFCSDGQILTQSWRASAVHAGAQKMKLIQNIPR